ncbi:hypothetical protein GCM10009678_04970 [Actinomadura kijaniata]|uniref:Uncharacterized protein n=1 Tax=Actinomadura namibiensis TaxID=182080 RepID=A0A7W3QNT3_ACTNM|nr:hypothetical protein [Actinomadura namibiensis]MBA8953939.1 hypothetical protein [Actinomadura namibiensis]
MINLRKTTPPRRADQARTGVTFVPPTGHSLTPLTGNDPCDQISDLWRLHEQSTAARRHRLAAHIALAALVTTIGITLVITLPPQTRWQLLTTAAALYGLYRATTTLWDWTAQHYRWPHTWDPTTGFGYRPQRRWYAPGQTVLLTTNTNDTDTLTDLPDHIAHVLWWITDPAMDQPWVVIHRDTQPAQVVPLNRLAPLPVQPDRTEARR